jgi:hypothetical protein
MRFLSPIVQPFVGPVLGDRHYLALCRSIGSKILICGRSRQAHVVSQLQQKVMGAGPSLCSTATTIPSSRPEAMASDARERGRYAWPGRERKRGAQQHPFHRIGDVEHHPRTMTAGPSRPHRVFLNLQNTMSYFRVSFFRGAECACSGSERMIEQGSACCTLYSFRPGPITKSCLLQGAPGGAAHSMRRAARAA